MIRKAAWTCVLSMSLVSVLLASASSSRAAVRAAKVFGDHMVLQQELPIAVWGWADAGEQVSVELSGSKAIETKAGADGAWRVDLPAVKADGKPHTLTIKGSSNTVPFKDVLLGEVWLASGQSNMARGTGIQDETPGVRVWLRSRQKRHGPIPTPNDYGDETVCTWSPATPDALQGAPQTVQRNGKLGPHRSYGEVAYVFARTIHEQLKVPVGVMNIAWGGSTAKAWTPKPEIEKEYPFGKPAEGGYIGHRDGLMYQSQLLPIVPLTIRGVIWYQGEDDGRNKKYAEDFGNLIRSWRKLWNQPEMPFYFVQIAQTTYASGMLNVWTDQIKIQEGMPNTGLAVSNDIYDNGGTIGADVKTYTDRRDANSPDNGLPVAGSSNPHPPHKDLVARRLAQIALVKAYGQAERPIFGPIYESHKVDGDKVVVKLKYAYDGLKTSDSKAPIWFQLSDGTMDGRKMKFHNAEAKITAKDTIEVTSAKVKSPKYVRFAWNTSARHNLVNSGGLPAVSFTTDDKSR